MIEEEGWRGQLKILNIQKNWYNKIDKKFRLEKTIGWQIVIIREINQFNSIIETDDNLRGVINFKDISWTKKEFKELFKVGDVIYVEK